MTDLLSGLRKDTAAGNWTTNDLPSALAYNQAIHEAREALRNPTDEQVDALANEWVRHSTGRGFKCSCGEWAYWQRETFVAHRVRAVLAAAAGGDDE